MTWTQTGMQTSFYEMISKIFIIRLKVYLDKVLGCRNTRDTNLTTRLTDWVEGWDGIAFKKINLIKIHINIDCQSVLEIQTKMDQLVFNQNHFSTQTPHLISSIYVVNTLMD